MARAWRRKGRSTEVGEHVERALSVTEAAAVRQANSVPASRGFPSDIPLGGTTKQNAGYQGQTDRRAFMDELYGAYLACPWASGCVDVVAQTVTAGGLEIHPETDGTQADDPQPTPEVKAVQELLDFVNPKEDSREISRGGIQDLRIFGDAFFELVWFAGRIVAIYSLDAPSMIPIADEHGTISGYTQMLDPNRTVDFEPQEIIQCSLNAPRGGLYGVGPMQKTLIPITAWLFTEGLLKETMRKGNPKPTHIDYPLSTDKTEIERQRQMYMVRNIGIENIGAPLMTRGGASVEENGQNQIAEYLATLNNLRDTILSGHGVPPSKLGVIEAGNLGGGTGTSQERTFQVNTCGPTAEAFLEKFTYHLIQEAFGITGWRANFGDVDWRDDMVLEQIRDMRIRNGTWTINRGRAQAGEKPVDGGDDALLVDRQNLVMVSDLPDFSKAAVAALQAKGAPAQDAEMDAGVEPAPGSATAGAPGAEPGAKPVTTPPKAEAGESVTVAASNGVMIAIVPPAEIAASLAVPGGLSSTDLHVTLAYLGHATDLPSADDLLTVVKAWALTTPALQCTISGVGLFSPSASSDGLPVTYASIDCPGLPAARELLVELLTGAGLPVSSAHGFTPHMTLAYADLVGSVAIPPGSFVAGSVTVFVGDDRTVIDLTGTAESLAEAEMASAWQRTYSQRRSRALAELSA